MNREIVDMTLMKVKPANVNSVDNDNNNNTYIHIMGVLYDPNAIVLH